MSELIRNSKLTKVILFRKYCLKWTLFTKEIFSKFKSNCKLKPDFKDSKRLLLNRKNEELGINLFVSMIKYINVSIPGGLKKFTRIDKKFIRSFYSHFLMVFHTDEVIGEASTRDEITKKLVRNASDIYINLNKLDDSTSFLQHRNHLISLLISIRLFMNNFEEWKEKDKMQMVRQCIYNYWELEIVKYKKFNDDEQHLSVIKQMESQQKFTLNNLKMIDSQNAMKLFNEFIPFLNTKLFKGEKEETLKLIYWELYRLELYQDKPPRFDKLKTIMHCLKNKIKQVFPNKVKHKYINELNQKFDIKFICDMIEKKVYTMDQLKSFTGYLISLLKFFDAPSQDELNKTVHQLLIKFMDKFASDEKITITEKIGESWIIVFENIYPIFHTLVLLKEKFQSLINI